MCVELCFITVPFVVGNKVRLEYKVLSLVLRMVDNKSLVIAVRVIYYVWFLLRGKKVKWV